MPESSTLAHQLALLGIKIPPWPVELEEDKNKGNWIGKAYLKVIKLWQAQVQDTSPVDTNYRSVVATFARNKLIGNVGSTRLKYN